MTDRQKKQKTIIKNIVKLETGGFKVIQGNFNLTILKKEWWRIEVEKIFTIKNILTDTVFYNVKYKELETLACELNKFS